MMNQNSIHHLSSIAHHFLQRARRRRYRRSITCHSPKRCSTTSAQNQPKAPALSTEKPKIKRAEVAEVYFYINLEPHLHLSKSFWATIRSRAQKSPPNTSWLIPPNAGQDTLLTQGGLIQIRQAFTNDRQIGFTSIHRRIAATGF